MSARTRTAETAAAMRTWPEVRLAQRWSGLDQPASMKAAGDGSGRLYVCERPGRVRLIEHGELRDAPFLDIADRVGLRHTEQGLLDIAFPPGEAASDHFYVCYTDPLNDVIVSRFRIGEAGGGDPDTEEPVLPMWHPYRTHNGGQMQFGPDGCLYVGIGDGGSANDPCGYGQDPSVVLAKIVRIDPEAALAETHEGGEECACGYHIRDDNPFLGYPHFAPETWHWGLRNPWRFSFDRETGDMFIGDVGQGTWEEIDFAPAGVSGLNFGWSIREGAHPRTSGSEPGHDRERSGEADLIEPVAEYNHAEDRGTAVIGGYIYRGRKHEAMRGVYFYADYGSGKLYGMRRGEEGAWESTEIAETGLPVTSFAEDDEGELYATDLNGGVHSIGV